MVERWSWLGDPLAVDVANTVQLRGEAYIDLLQTPADLAEWAYRETSRIPALLDPVRPDQLTHFLRARDSILALLRSAAGDNTPPQAAVDTLNAILVDRPVIRLLTPAGEVGDVHLLDRRDPVEDLVAEAAFDAVELLHGPDRDRLKLCLAPSCGQLYLRHRTNQRWCSDDCGNRARGARHHQRSHLLD